MAHLKIWLTSIRTLSSVGSNECRFERLVDVGVVKRTFQRLQGVVSRRPLDVRLLRAPRQRRVRIQNDLENFVQNFLIVLGLPRVSLNGVLTEAIYLDCPPK